MDLAPAGLRRTPEGSGAHVRFDLAHQPLPEIPLPIDTATWPDPTSRTGLRVNASLVAPTAIEQQARERFSQMEGWGTFSPIAVAFDIDRSDPAYASYDGTALDLGNIRRRHQGDDYDFSDDAIYLVNLTTGVPVPLDLGAGNYNYTLKKLDKYWANDTRVTERNLLFDTIDETRKGAVTPTSFLPDDDTDFDGTLDRPNLDDPNACPSPDPVCDNVSDPSYGTPMCTNTRRVRDRCVADHLVSWYERETDTLLLRPVIPLDEMTRYAVVLTDRLLDGKGNAIKSPFDFVYHASMEPTAARVRDIINDPKHAEYFGRTGSEGGIAGSGLDHVAFTWSFTTQPTVDDMKRLRDGLYGQGPFARWADQYPPRFTLERAIGLRSGILTGDSKDDDNWQSSEQAKKANCAPKVGNLYVINYKDIREDMRRLLVDGFGLDPGPGSELLLKSFDNIDRMVVGTYKSPFLLEGGPKSTDPNAAFKINYVTGEAEETSDTIQFWLIIPKETAQHHQPFNVDIYGHGYTGNFSELLLYAGNMAEHGLATIGINAMGHGLSFDNKAEKLAATGALEGACAGPFYDAIAQTRARDLNNDGIPDSGGDFWSSYLFHTRDGVRQSILDHIQLVRILRSFGTPQGQMLCRNAKTGWMADASEPCDPTGDGKAEIAGDFDGDGVADIGGPTATYGTWGESLGGILSGIHGAIDAYVTSAVPGSGGGGLTDIGIRSFQGGVVEAVLLRIWGPLLVSIPSGERKTCDSTSAEKDRCTLCAPGELSLRWVMPDLNGTGEAEIGCFTPDKLVGSTVFVTNKNNGELKCASIGDNGRLRIGLPSSIGDQVQIDVYEGKNQVTDYKTCTPLFNDTSTRRFVVDTWGKGRIGQGTTNDVGTETCLDPTCAVFQGHFYGEGTPLTAPAEGFGLIRQTPSVRRFIQLAQMALEPGDPASFAPFYSIRPMTDPFGTVIKPHALLTLNTIGDMNVPLNAGIAFGRASGALPLFRPDQIDRFPEYANYATPDDLYRSLGNRTPNQVLIDDHVIEGITALARHPAGVECATSANAADPEATFPTRDGKNLACFPTGCTMETEANGDAKKRVCYYDTHCNFDTGKCEPNTLGQTKCDEALFDADDLDEGAARYYEQNAPTPLRLARYTQPADGSLASVNAVWEPRLLGVPKGADNAWSNPDRKPLTALLDAYIVPEGVHTFTNGEPCQAFDAGTYLTNLTARFFMTDGEDVYYLSHPTSHRCLASPDVTTCGYLKP
ncbi:MAG: hypothetical protein U0359_30245 [Byssovorax sp.]